MVATFTYGRKLAGHIGRRTDNRWSTVVMDWAPKHGKRRVGHPLTRWADSIDSFAREYFDENDASYWRLMVFDRRAWSDARDVFAGVSL